MTVSNVGGAASVGAVSVTDALPGGLTATSISGAGWTCVLATLTCTRSDVLASGASYSPITLTVNVASSAPASLVNNAAVSGGGDTNVVNNTSSAITPLGLVSAPPTEIPTLSPAALAVLMLLIVLAVARRQTTAARARQTVRR